MDIHPDVLAKAESIRAVQENLFRAFEPAYSEGYWPYSRNAHEPIARFVLSVFAQLALEDQRLSQDEQALFHALYSPDGSLDPEDVLAWRVEHSRDVLASVPSFLRSIVRYDQLHGTTFAQHALQSIEELGIAVLGRSIPDSSFGTFLQVLREFIADSDAQFEAPLSTTHVRVASTVIPDQDETNRRGAHLSTEVSAPLAELDALVGLSTVKQEVRNIVSLLRIRQLRAAKQLPNPDISLHMVFTGSPGTGKTTVARIIARIYAALGVLPSARFVETDRSGLVAGYVGQTALKVRRVVDSATGGLLFIDEAYSLARSSETHDYGSEAIETLLKLMEDSRDRLIVIVAGYTELMHRFIDSNPGLSSRFNRYIDFPDYSSAELLEIFLRRAHAAHYVVPSATQEQARAILEAGDGERSRSSGNARLVRNLLEWALVQHAARLDREEVHDDEALVTLTPSDLNGFA